MKLVWETLREVGTCAETGATVELRHIEDPDGDFAWEWTAMAGDFRIAGGLVYIIGKQSHGKAKHHARKLAIKAIKRWAMREERASS